MHLHRRLRRLSALAVALPSLASAQDSTRTRPDTDQPRLAPTPPFEFSGIVFLNYQYGGARGNRSVNRFEAERAYLTFRAWPGDRFGVRITADLYQQRDTTRDQYYRGWGFRAKYAYGQYDFIRGAADALRANVRLGMLPTIVVDQEEQYWQRGLSSVAVEQNGFFQSSDLGAAATVTLPSKLGEIYATITNGSGYSSRETDRFKDYALRLTLTPLANGIGFLKGLAISPWYSKGNRASDFARRRGTVLAIDDALEKNRAGVFAGIRDSRIALGAHFAQRWDVVEAADTTRDIEPTGTHRTGRVISLHTTAQPLAYLSSQPTLPIAIVLRYDRITPDVDRAPYARNTIAGLQWALNRRTTVTFDYQNQTPKNGSTATDTKVYFLHLIAAF